MSDVELLREAAKTMRRRAEDATDGPWRQLGYHVHAPDNGVCYDAFTTADAKHIASWHPAVALAVADWLDFTAERLALAGALMLPYGAAASRAVAVARAYLGRDER